LILFIFPLLQSLFSGGTTQPAGPRMVFDTPEPPFTQERETANLKVKYFVNPRDVQSYTQYKLSQLDKNAEIKLVRHLRAECENEMLHKQRLYDEAQGWFRQDPIKMDVANRFETPSCRRLEKMGVGR